MKHKSELLFLPLGGSGEIGMNMNLFAVGPAEDRQWVMIDCGVTFGDSRSPGVDLICPDPAYIVDEAVGDKSLLALLLTHAHEDHIGAVAHLWPRLNCPIYATAFTAELVRRKFEEQGILNPPLNIIPMEARFQLGRFDFEYVTLTHSIPEPNGIIIRTEHGVVLHTGDWKIDIDPSLGPLTDSATLKQLGAEGVLAMVCDSTNVLSAGTSGSEMRVQENLVTLIAEQSGKVAVTTFASNVGRLVSICIAAAKNDRAICLMGRSMLRMMEVARQVGLLPEHIVFVDLEEAAHLPDRKILFLCTGSQGEPRAALARIARDDHRHISLGEGDSVIFSSKIIPGNERTIYDLQNQLIDMGVKVITEKDEFVHVSGHPCRDELRQMYQWVRPKIAIPVHGEARHLEEHCRFALELGAEESISVRNGDVVRLAPGAATIIDEVPAGRLYIDGKIHLPEGSGVMRDRRKLNLGGIILSSVVFDHKNRLMAPPELALLGVPLEDNQRQDLIEPIEQAVDMALESLPKGRAGDDQEVTKILRRAIRQALDPIWGKRCEIAILVNRI